VVLTGANCSQKMIPPPHRLHRRIKERSAKFIMEGRFPERIVEKAIERMLAARTARPGAIRQPARLTRVPIIRTPRRAPKSSISDR